MSFPKAFASYLLTPHQLFDALTGRSDGGYSGRIVPLSAAWFLPSDGRKGIDSFERGHIPGSYFCELNSLAEEESPFAHMLPTAQQFASVVGQLGITPQDAVVVYDTEEVGIFSAPRVAWVFQVFGHSQIYILNSFKLWVQLGLPTISGPAEVPQPTVYATPTKDIRRTISFHELRELITDGLVAGSGTLQVLDSRAPERWHRAADKKLDFSTGHMPFSINVPLSKIVNPDTGSIFDAATLRRVFAAEGVDGSKTLVTSCGAGITAAIINVALEEAGYGDGLACRLYDGSWREWSRRVGVSEGLVI